MIVINFVLTNPAIPGERLFIWHTQNVLKWGIYFINKINLVISCITNVIGPSLTSFRSSNTLFQEQRLAL